MPPPELFSNLYKYVPFDLSGAAAEVDVGLD